MARDSRDREIEARKAAFKAARLMANEGIGQSEAIRRVGSSRYSISQATMILQHGSVAEIAAVESGALALGTVYGDILKRTTREQRMLKRFAPAVDPTIKEARKLAADVWQQLRTALGCINSLPSPKDTAAIVRKNPQRMEYVSRTVLASLEWIQEFSDEITR